MMLKSVLLFVAFISMAHTGTFAPCPDRNFNCKDYCKPCCDCKPLSNSAYNSNYYSCPCRQADACSSNCDSCWDPQANCGACPQTMAWKSNFGSCPCTQTPASNTNFGLSSCSQPLASNSNFGSSTCTQNLADNSNFGSWPCSQNSACNSNLGSFSQCMPCSLNYAPYQCPCPQVVTSPVVTTVVDNSVSLALANVLQLLIVSNLLENTMTCKEPVAIVVEEPTEDECDEEEAEIVVCDEPCVCETKPDSNCGSIPDSNCGSILDCDYEAILNSLPPRLSGLGCLSDLTSISPCIAEALLPSSIPANLVCNFECPAQSEPRISFDVQPSVDTYKCGYKCV